MNPNCTSSKNPVIYDDEQLEQWLNFPPSQDNDNIDALFTPLTQTIGEPQLISHPSQRCKSVPVQVQVQVQDRERCPSDKNKGRKNRAMVNERERRREMATLHASLRTLLPAEYIKGKRTISDHLELAAKYIRNLEENIKHLNTKRDELIMMKPTAVVGSSCTTENQQNKIMPNQNYVTVNPCKEGFIEIIVKENQQGLPLSKLLHLLSCEGLDVMNTITSKTGNNWIYTIKAMIGEGKDVDLRLVQQKLMDNS